MLPSMQAIRTELYRLCFLFALDFVAVSQVSMECSCLEQEVRRKYLWRFAKAIQNQIPVGGGESKTK